jgi:hypothetical protein
MSEGRRAINIAAIAALVVAVAAGAAAGYVYQRQEASVGVLEKRVKELRDRQKGAEAARLGMERVRLASFGSLNEGMRGIWIAVRGLQKDLRSLDARLAKIEEKSGGSPAFAALKKRMEAIGARSALLQARVAALERRKGGSGKTIFVEGGGTKRKATGQNSKKGGAGTRTSKQPPFWDGCIDSLNKSARLSKSAEGVCDCIIGRIRKADAVPGKDRRRILRQSKFTTRVRGISRGAQKVLEQAVVQCALRHFKKKKK